MAFREANDGATGWEVHPAVWAPGSETRFAASVVRDAGRLLLDLRSQEEEGLAPSGAALGELGRRCAGSLIRNRLLATFPGDAVTFGKPARKRTNRRTWEVVALDDAKAYGRPGSPYWAVHVALHEPGHGVTAAVVAVPALCGMATSTGSRALWHHPESPPGTAPILLHDGARGQEAAVTLAHRAGARPRAVASPGARTLAVADGTADACLHSGADAGEGTAVAAVAAALGLHTVRPAELGTVPGAADSDVLLCRAPLARALRAAPAAPAGRPAGRAVRITAPGTPARRPVVTARR